LTLSVINKDNKRPTSKDKRPHGPGTRATRTANRKAKSKKYNDEFTYEGGYPHHSFFHFEFVHRSSTIRTNRFCRLPLVYCTIQYSTPLVVSSSGTANELCWTGMYSNVIDLLRAYSGGTRTLLISTSTPTCSRNRTTLATYCIAHPVVYDIHIPPDPFAFYCTSSTTTVGFSSRFRTQKKKKKPRIGFPERSAGPFDVTVQGMTCVFFLGGGAQHCQRKEGSLYSPLAT
jgi:hypothetical protein